MIKIIYTIVTLLHTVSLIAQSSVRLEIKSLPDYHATGSTIYIAGSFNGWNPQDDKFKFQRSGNGDYFIDLKINDGKYEFKITRGGWDKVECRKGGGGIENRVLIIPGTTTVQLDIQEWADRFPAKPKVSTAGKNVQVVDPSFLIPQLKRIRKVWIYLPDGYAASKERYPVLYMHDGQNVFDDATAFSGEWGVDDFFDSTTSKKSIVVAIDHGDGKRINEYCPYDMDRFGKGEGNQYVDFLVKTLKPFIDKRYRTLKDKKNTSIAGSSMGGLISMYAVLKYPKVFGGVGVFSPAFWISGSRIFDDIRKKGKKVNSKIYFYGGKQEGENMVPGMLKAFEEMSKVSKSKMTTIIRDEGKHNEARWREEFPLFYDWLINK